jgi:hypothetical protein
MPKSGDQFPSNPETLQEVKQQPLYSREHIKHVKRVFSWQLSNFVTYMHHKDLNFQTKYFRFNECTIPEGFGIAAGRHLLFLYLSTIKLINKQFEHKSRLQLTQDFRYLTDEPKSV